MRDAEREYMATPIKMVIGVLNAEANKILLLLLPASACVHTKKEAV